MSLETAYFHQSYSRGTATLMLTTGVHQAQDLRVVLCTGEQLLTAVLVKYIPSLKSSPLALTTLGFLNTALVPSA
jgi:uncharacterized membrane protein (UPF0136 family)